MGGSNRIELDRSVHQRANCKVKPFRNFSTKMKFLLILLIGLVGSLANPVEVSENDAALQEIIDMMDTEEEDLGNLDCVDGMSPEICEALRPVHSFGVYTDEELEEVLKAKLQAFEAFIGKIMGESSFGAFIKQFVANNREYIIECLKKGYFKVVGLVLKIAKQFWAWVAKI